MPHLKPPYDYRLNKPFLTPIIDIIEENKRIKTFVLEYNPISTPVIIKPGQFVMVWVPGNDEIPMSISHVYKDSKISISVANIGETTDLLHKMKIGEQIGIRGPYGNNYEPKDGIAIVIGGGIGMASVLPLIREIIDIQSGNSQNSQHSQIKINNFFCIEGAKTKDELLFMDEIETIYYKIERNDSLLEFCTDDGTCGFKGYTTDKLNEILQIQIQEIREKNPNIPITVYACGPELMLHKLFHICEKNQIEIQVSLERMMRCGFGICGLCALEPTGLLVCRDGPIFTSEILRTVTDFGKIARDFTGRPIDI
jgi:dihydroorotate dehydrogenase electron transfer subunit